MLKKLIVFFSVLFLMACHGGGSTSSGSGDNPIDPEVLSSIEISSSVSSSLPVGVSVQMKATGVYTNGIRKEITSLVKWGVSGDAIRIDDSGMVTTVHSTTKAAPVIITASFGDKISEPLAISVKAKDVRLTSIVINSAGSLEVAKNGIIQLRAMGSYSDGSSLDLSNTVNWVVSDSSILSIAANGVASALAVGNVSVIASSGSISSNALVITVKDISLKSIEINIDDNSLVAGTSGKLTATGHYSDGSNQQLTNQVSWLSSDSSILNVTADGVAHANKAGTANVTASLAGVTSNSLNVTVRAATLKSIEINIDDNSLVAGTSSKLTATGHYSDGTNQQLTNQVSWLSSDSSILNVTADGVAHANKAGIANVTASLAGVTSNSLNVTVRAAALKNIEISINNNSLVEGTSGKLTAIGYYTDGSNQQLTNQVSWLSSDSSILNVTADGVAYANKAGTANVTASLAGVTSNGLNVTVSVATITKLEISVLDSTLVGGTSTPLKAIAYLSNNTTKDVTTQATWVNDGNNNQYISINKTSKLLLANALGSANVTFYATIKDGDNTITSNNLTVEVLNKVVMKDLVIKVFNNSGVRIDVDGTAKPLPHTNFYVKATAVFDNSWETTQDVTHNIDWIIQKEDVIVLLDPIIGQFTSNTSVGATDIYGKYRGGSASISSNIIYIAPRFPF